MRVRQLLRAISLLTVVATLAAGMVVITYSNRLTEVSLELQRAKYITDNVTSLLLITNGSMLERSERASEQLTATAQSSPRGILTQSRPCSPACVSAMHGLAMSSNGLSTAKRILSPLLLRDEPRYC